MLKQGTEATSVRTWAFLETKLCHKHLNGIKVSDNEAFGKLLPGSSYSEMPLSVFCIWTGRNRHFDDDTHICGVTGKCELIACVMLEYLSLYSHRGCYIV